MKRLLPFLILTLFLAGCASSEGPGSLETLSPGSSQTTQPAVQTVPRASTVSSQTLAAPGAVTTPNQNAASPNTSSQDQAVQPQSTPGTQTTLQDFSRIEPRPIFGNDPFATQDQPTYQYGLETPTSQQSLEDAVQAGLQGQTAPAPILAPVQPQFPRVALAPITTAPEPNATQLFDAIDDAVFNRGMQFVFFGDESAQFVVRSQVSAIPADAVTSVIYVFDVFDARGTLRHRVSGARAIPRSGPDGWALVDTNTTQLIAEDVATRLVAWLSQNAAG